MITAIRSRRDLEPTVISLKKLLEKESMGHYLDLCSDRLADELMIDGGDTKLNFTDLPDILFTESGLFDCRHILENYLSVDVLMDAWRLLLDREQINREVNSVAAAFRKMKLSEVATAMGIVIDKFVNTPLKNQLDRQKLELEIAKLESQIKDTQPEEEAEDNFLDAILNAVANNVWEDGQEKE